MSMPSVATQPGFDEAAYRARTTEDIVVGQEIIRHRLSTRLIHWSVAITFFLCVFTGLPVWTPIFGWLGNAVGGLTVCRVAHPLFGLLFAAATLAMFVHWAGEMKMTAKERGWIGPRLFAYLRDAENHAEIGKYNGGQKVFFFTSALAALALLLSGLVLWYPTLFPGWLRQSSILLHDVTFILFAISIVFHIYLGTTAEPGTFNAMTRGTVSKAWARIHHPKWYREIMGLEKRT